MARVRTLCSALLLQAFSGGASSARIFAAEYGTQVTLPCDENVNTPDEASSLVVFDAVWTDPTGKTLDADRDVGDDIWGGPRVDAFSGELSLVAVDYGDAGEYVCSARYADGESLTDPRESRHILQVACGPGLYGRNGTCRPCAIGKFNERYGALCCQQCPFLYVTWGRGAKSKHECSSVLHDFLVGLVVLACLSTNLYAFVKFCGPVVLDNLCEYVAPRPEASEVDPDLVDNATGDCMPENLFDGISRLIVRLKESPLPEVPTQESSPLLPSGNLSDESEDSEDDQSAVRYAYNLQSPEADVSGTPQPLPRPPASEFSGKITPGSPFDEESFPSYEAPISEDGNSSLEPELTSDDEPAGSTGVESASPTRRTVTSRYDVIPGPGNGVRRPMVLQGEEDLKCEEPAAQRVSSAGGDESQQGASYQVCVQRRPQRMLSSRDVSASSSDEQWYRVDVKRTLALGRSRLQSTKFDRFQDSGVRTHQPRLDAGQSSSSLEGMGGSSGVSSVVHSISNQRKCPQKPAYNVAVKYVAETSNVGSCWRLEAGRGLETGEEVKSSAKTGKCEKTFRRGSALQEVFIEPPGGVSVSSGPSSVWDLSSRATSSVERGKGDVRHDCGS
ncbi:uncharacterized protein LOC144159390 isoform X2 [Haemaphysalis longicornis]